MNERDGQEQGAGARATQWLWRVLATGLGLAVLALISGSLGNLSHALNGTLAVAGLLILALLWPRRQEPVPSLRLAIALAVMILSLPFVARGEPLGLLAASLFFFGLALLPLREKGTASALLLTALLFALYRILVAYWPALWHVEQWLAIYASWLVGVGLMLGPTAMGIPLLVLFCLVALTTFLLYAFPAVALQEPTAHQPRRGRALLVTAGWLVGLILAAGAYIWLQPPLGSWLLTYWPDPPTPSTTPILPPTLTYLDSQLLLFGLLWLVSALVGLGLRPRALPLLSPGRKGAWAAAGLALLALGAILLTLQAPYQPARGTILFYDTGHLDWGRPAFGSYGPHSSGDFGLWPDYLESYGYEAKTGLLTEENLAQAKAVVLINLPELLEQQEKERLLAFVEEGGGLLIWGEHTGVGRIREPVNDLLESIPIHLRFDSAVPTRSGWPDGLTFLPHPAVIGIQNPLDLVIAVGASLHIEPPARPIIVGRFGHSDIGDRTNWARNFVGDMRYNPGERLGDVVLAAEAGYGQGRIVVVGDTTPLGSVNLMTTMPFHIQLLDWVTAGKTGFWHSLLPKVWLAGWLLLVAAICLALGRSRSTLAAAALVLGLSLALTTRLNTAQSTPPVPDGPIAYVDMSHQERFDRVLWEETSIGGLDYNLVRNGTLPLLLRDLDAEALDKAQLLVLIAPGDRFSAGEIDLISSWVEGGGRLLISVGWEESEASQSLLDAFGLRVDHIPLGPAEVERETGLVRFHEAWPVGATYSDARPIVERYGYPLILHQPWGRGSVVLIGDSAFLLGSNLEGETEFEEGNILLLRDIMQQAFGFGGEP